MPFCIHTVRNDINEATLAILGDAISALNIAAQIIRTGGAYFEMPSPHLVPVSGGVEGANAAAGVRINEYEARQLRGGPIQPIRPLRPAGLGGPAKGGVQ